jgi:hypothetical protein
VGVDRRAQDIQFAREFFAARLDHRVNRFGGHLLQMGREPG